MNPGGTTRRERAVAEVDRIVLRCHPRWPVDNDYAGLDIVRFDDNGKIVEHRDVLQIVPETSANSNTIFQPSGPLAAAIERRALMGNLRSSTEHFETRR